jgi:hypothetical protein
MDYAWKFREARFDFPDDFVGSFERIAFWGDESDLQFALVIARDHIDPEVHHDRYGGEDDEQACDDRNPPVFQGPLQD